MLEPRPLRSSVEGVALRDVFEWFERRRGAGGGRSASLPDTVPSDDGLGAGRSARGLRVCLGAIFGLS